MQTMMSEETMKTKLSTTIFCVLASVALVCMASITVLAQSQNATAVSGPKAFNTPQQAAGAFIAAAAAYDVSELMARMGPDGKDLFESADPVQDKNNALAFANEAQAKNSVQVDPNGNCATIIVGEEQWPLPTPIVKKNGEWYFDTKAGRQEILFRRIGANELDAIEVCHIYVDAQVEYASEIRDSSGVNQYAQKVMSTPGKQDGLYWKAAAGSPESPLGDQVARALAEGYTIGKEGFHGYYFKILKGQGPAARMGRMDYVIEGIMIGGFALAAVPAEYRVTGVKTFLVSADGIVYQKDLGPGSFEIVKKMELYNPDKTWQPTDDEWPQDVAPAKP